MSGPPVGGSPARRRDLRAVGTPPDHDARGLAWLAATLGAAALAGGVALAVSGESWPSPAMLVVFAFLAWFAVNRYTFFPTELAVTSESAVLLAAVVVFHGGAAFLGPWCVAALVGPLDAVHWEHRAFSRMGFNAAHQMLAVVAAAAAFGAVATRGDTAAVEVLAVVAAIASYAVVVWIAGVAVLHVWSRLRLRDALPQLLALDWVVVPLGLLGALAGVAASAHGWWALPMVLVPTAFLPEVMLSHGRVVAAAFAVSSRVRGFVLVVVAALVLAPAVVALRAPPALIALGVLLLGALAAVELRPRRRALVPPAAGVVVTVAVAVAGLGGVAWWSPARSAGAFGAGLLLAVAAACSAPLGARRIELARAGWALPLFAVGAGAALAVPRFGPVAIAAPVALVPVAAALVVAWALPPWSSGLLAPTLASHRFAARRVALAALVATGVATAVAATQAAGGARDVLALVSLAVLEVGLTVAAAGARQWRLDPHRRRVVAVLVVATAVALLAAVPTLTRHAPQWLVLPAVVAGAVVLLVGDAPARLGDAADRPPTF